MSSAKKDVADMETSCGLFGWRPRRLQRLADARVYVLLYFTIGVLQSTIFSYLSVVITSLEKRFGLQSQETAWIYSGNEISQICFIFFLPFVGRVKKRPLWLGLTMCLSALGMFLIATPHFFGAAHDNAASDEGLEKDVCLAPGAEGGADRETSCSGDDAAPVKDVGSLAVIFLGIFLVGIGVSFFYSFGIPYVDDNSGKTDSPFLLAVVASSRTLGPTLGYVLGGVFLKYYVEPSKPPVDFDEDDPRWIGAWWLGFVVVSVCVLALGPLMTLFPPKLPAKNTDAHAKEEEEPEPETVAEWWAELKGVGKRLLTNKIWLLNLASTIFLLFGFIGFATFVPKFFEYHFRQRASNAGTAGGLTKAAASVVGMLTSGWLIGKFKPKAKTLAGLCVVGSLSGVVAFAAVSLLRCPPLHIDGPIGSVNASTTSCSSSCQCQEVAYHPVCSRDGVTIFFSPCHAGCKAANFTGGGEQDGGLRKNLYWDCSCVEEHWSETRLPAAGPWWEQQQEDREGAVRPLDATSDMSVIDSAVDGYCPFDCNRVFFSLLGVLFFAALINAATRIPNMLISLRIISPSDKAASLTLSVSALSLFSFLPAPIVFGRLVDAACKLWGEKCGQRTNCLVFDTDALRVNLGATAAVCMALGVLCDLGVWYLVGDLNLYEQADGKDKGAGSNNEREDSGIDSLKDRDSHNGMGGVANGGGVVNGSFVEIELTEDAVK